MTSLTQFHLFSNLPTEIRLKIWHFTLPSRVVEVRLKDLPLRDETKDMDDAAGDVEEEQQQQQSETSSIMGSESEEEEETNSTTGPSAPFHMPYSISRPAPLPTLFHINRETRKEALRLYRPCNSDTFDSPYSNQYHNWPSTYTLYSPSHDTLYFPLSLYRMQTAQSLPSVMFSGTAAQTLGIQREFILDRLAAGATPSTSYSQVVSEIETLAISWEDMHIKTFSALKQALVPYTRLRMLYLVFFEQRCDDTLDARLSFRGKGGKRGRFGVRLVRPDEEAVVVVVARGRFLQRVLEEYEGLAGELSEGFRRERESGVDDGRPVVRVEVRMARFEKVGRE